MKTLIFNGSPRKNGDTMSLINKLTENLQGEYKLVNAYDCDIAPCVDCRFCKKHQSCCVKDDMQEVYDYIKDCDNIVIASPIYFSELTGKLLDVGSRLQRYFCARHFRHEEPIPKKKKGAVILVGGGDGSGDKAEETAKTLLKVMNVENIFPTVVSHNTDNVPAAKDAAALSGIGILTAFLNSL